MKTLKFTLLMLVALIFTACEGRHDDSKMEYCVVTFTSEKSAQSTEALIQAVSGTSALSAKLPPKFENPREKLMEMSIKGWELVDVYTIEETVFPNYGNEEYHTGIKQNTRTCSINFVFKRPMSQELQKKYEEKYGEKKVEKLEVNAPSNEEECVIDSFAAAEVEFIK